MTETSNSNFIHTSEIKEVEMTDQMRDEATANYFHLLNLDRDEELGRITKDQKNRMIARLMTLKGVQVETHYEEARTDHLTKLPNRRAYDEEFNSVVETGEPFGMLMLDLDHFKKLNDGLGHGAGDIALIQVALRIIGCIRQAPIVMPGGFTKVRSKEQTDFAARIGGEEIAILLKGVRSNEGLSIVAERIRDAIAESEFSVVDKKGTTQSVPITVSIGGAIYAGGSTENFYRAVDDKLYQAKAEGRNRVVI